MTMKKLAPFIVLAFIAGVAIAAYNQPQLDFALEVSRGNVSGTSSITKFGRSTNVDSSEATDLWDRANATNDQAIWLAPTAARKHDIVSGATVDHSTGVGARTMKVFGLPDWDTAEVNETIILAGTSAMTTSNSYVIIHRMLVVSSGASGPNVGLLTATAASDGTITAQINIPTAAIPTGQTHMAVYGIPSSQSGYFCNFWIALNSATPSATSADITFLINPFPDDQPDVWLSKHTTSLQTVGTSTHDHAYCLYKKVTGPAIVKLQVPNVSSNDSDFSGGFDAFVIDN